MTSNVSVQINSLSFAIAGSFVSADNNNCAVYLNTDADLQQGDASLITAFSSVSPGTFTISSGIGDEGIIPAGVHYLIVGIYITPGATSGHTLTASKFTLGTTPAITSDNQAANAGTKTIS